jgi:hypothetical protein
MHPLRGTDKKKEKERHTSRVVLRHCRPRPRVEILSQVLKPLAKPSETAMKLTYFSFPGNTHTKLCRFPSRP